MRFNQMSLRLRRWGHWQRLAAGRQWVGEQNCPLAELLGLLAWRDWGGKGIYTTPVSMTVPRVIPGSTTGLDMVPGPTSQYCQTAPYLLFAYAEIMKNYSTVIIIIIIFKECLISLNNPENIVIYLSAVTGFAHPMSNFVFPHHHPSYKRNGQGHPLLSPRA